MVVWSLRQTVAVVQSISLKSIPVCLNKTRHHQPLYQSSQVFPKGVSLVPLLFVIFINDLPLFTNFSDLFLFADDTKSHCKISSPADCILAQNDLDSLNEWSINNELYFNESKSVLVRFCHKSISNYTYSLNLKHIDEKPLHKDLGVLLSYDLCWSDHHHSILAKAYKSLGLIRRVFCHTTSISGRKKLYMSLVRSQLMYCSCIWRPHLLKTSSN